jgi:hypothetical protein
VNIVLCLYQALQASAAPPPIVLDHKLQMSHIQAKDPRQPLMSPLIHSTSLQSMKTSPQTQISLHTQATPTESPAPPPLHMQAAPWRITFDTNPDDCNLSCIMCEEHSIYSKSQAERKAG